MSRQLRETSFRLALDGRWTAQELAALMRSIEDIYNLMALLSTRRLNANDLQAMFPLDRRIVRRMMFDLSGVEALLVPGIRYASPGWADFLGAARAIKHVKDFLVAILDRALDTKKRRLENEKRDIANEKALSDLRFNERAKEATLNQKLEVHQLRLQREQLRNLELAERVQAVTLKNVERELSVFSESLSRLARDKELSPEQQAQMVHWVGSRMQPIAQLAEGGKLVRVDEASSPGESSAS